MEVTVILLPLHPASLTHKPSPKMQINLHYASRRMQRSNYRSEDVFVEYPVCVISVAVVDEAVVKQCLFPLVFVVLYNGRSISLFQ